MKNRSFARSGALRRATWLLACTMLMSSCATGLIRADTPVIHVGDRWVFQIRTDRPAGPTEIRRVEDEVIATDPDSMVVRRTTAGGSIPPVETRFARDWSRLREIDGRSIRIARDLDFPLTVGKTWNNEYLDVRPGDPSTRLLRSYRYEVVAREDVVTPAGRFAAFRIETHGGWHVSERAADASVQGAVQDAGELHFVAWYAPACGRIVRIDEDVVRLPREPVSRSVIELQSFFRGDSRN